MKIDAQAQGNVPMQTPLGARRRLSGETTFDRTLQQMESGMWRGAEAGRQPTPVLPQEVAPSTKGGRTTGLPVLVTAPPTMTSPAPPDDRARTEGVSSSVEAWSTIATPFAETTHASDSMQPFGAVLEPSPPEQRDVIDAADGPDAMRQTATPRTNDPASIPENSRVTWLESAAGSTVVLRHVRRGQVDLHFVRDALAQLRRHGLDPKRLIINGATSSHPLRHGDPA